MYIGAPRFGARIAAGNSIEDIAELVQYAHTYGVQVLVTLNTLLREEEYPQAVALAHALYSIGVDALIIQDLRLLRYDLPPIRLHASTQCDNRTPQQAIRMQQLGFKRIVLARELSIEEIRAIHDAVLRYSSTHHEEPIELEAFVHGALCVSYSGRCYISEVLASRSANRGECSQFCRMAYDLLDANRKEVADNEGQPIHQRYVLSLQDMDRRANLAELVDAGVTTFKIEGRLKDKEYVTNITACYRQALDALIPPAQRLNKDIFHCAFTPNPAKTFHRGGTDYFLHGRTPHMANWATPKSTGELIGEVVETRGNRMRVRLLPGIELHTGDGLAIDAEGCFVNGIEGEWIKINKTLPQTRAPQTRTPLFRNLDVAFIHQLQCERKRPIDILFRATEDGFVLSYTLCAGGATGNRCATKRWIYPHEAARDADKALLTIRTQLAKLGDTPYTARTATIDSDPYFIPVAVLNTWRRETIALLEGNKPTPQVTPSAEPSAEPSGESPVLAILPDNTPEEPLPLMTCRYCLLYELGHCRKTNPYPKEREPLFLRLRNDTLLRLVFDCKLCQMRIYKSKI